MISRNIARFLIQYCRTLSFSGNVRIYRVESLITITVVKLRMVNVKIKFVGK